MASRENPADGREEELMQELSRRFRSKDALHDYLFAKSVSSKPLLSRLSCSSSSSRARSTAASTFSSNC